MMKWVHNTDTRVVDTRFMAERKHHCRRDGEPDREIAGDDADKSFRDNQDFLAEAMHELIGRTDADVESYLRGERNPDALADIVHDGLVSVWDRPMADYGQLPEELQIRWSLWTQFKTSTKRQLSPKLGEHSHMSSTMPAEEPDGEAIPQLQAEVDT